MRRFRRHQHGCGQRGAALLEVALVTPLFLTIVYGTWNLVALARARYQLAVVAHAIMREAAAGTTSATLLTGLANGYAKAIVLPATAHVVVTVESAGLPTVPGGTPVGPFRSLFAAATPGTRIKVAAVLPVGRPLRRIWSAGLPVAFESVCISGTWKAPFAALGRVLHIPGMSRAGAAE